MKVSKWFVAIAAIFITTLITANIIAVKLISLGGLILPAAVIIFPASYIFGDVLTEVYGYRLTRFVIWLGFLCNKLPAAPWKRKRQPAILAISGIGTFWLAKPGLRPNGWSANYQNCR